MMRTAIVTFLFAASRLDAFEPMHIQDNSFLIEEAYNQEPGVYQYISTFVEEEGEQLFTFTNEIPVRGQQHQFSYTLDSDLDDVMLNYRYQLAGDGTKRLAISPRVSLVVPVDDGSEWGYELNLPVSVAHSSRLVTHWNAGVTSIADTSWFAGGSVIGAVREKFHLMLETRWDSEDDFVVAPGIRWAWDLRNGFQVVPGIAVPIGEESTAVFLYLSLER